MKQYSKEELVAITIQVLSGKLASTISHKAKNILMPLTGYIELIEGGVSNDKQKRYFKKIETSCHDLQSLLKKFLRFSQPFQERIEEAIDISALIEDVLLLFDHYITLSRVTLKKDIDPTGEKARGVYDEVSLIIASVLINAIEASPKGGVVRIGTEVVDNRIRISIDDDGPGVSEEIKDKIFEPFFTTKKACLGLGLATGIFLAKGMEGFLALEGKNKFILSLPSQ